MFLQSNKGHKKINHVTLFFAGKTLVSCGKSSTDGSCDSYFLSTRTIGSANAAAIPVSMFA